MSLRVEIFPADLDATVRFYIDVLLFRLVRDERAAQSAYVSLQRGAVRVGAAGRPDVANRGQQRPPVGVELVLEVDDVERERERVRRAGWPVVEDLVERPWGRRDFRLLDPSGYYLRITGRTPEP